MFSSTTEELVTGHSAPLTIDVDAETLEPSAPHAALIGIVGVGVGDEGVDEEPPPHPAASSTTATISRLVMIAMADPYFSSLEPP
jgi:hypothetical protein